MGKNWRTYFESTFNCGVLENSCELSNFQPDFIQKQFHLGRGGGLSRKRSVVRVSMSVTSSGDEASFPTHAGSQKDIRNHCVKTTRTPFKKEKQNTKMRNGFLLGFFVVNFETFSFGGDQTD